MHDALERRANLGARHDEHVKPQMNRSSLASLCLIACVLRRGVKQSGFVVPPDSDRHALLFHSRKNRPRKRMDFSLRRIGAEHEASRTQVENVERGRPQVRLHYTRAWVALLF